LNDKYFHTSKSKVFLPCIAEPSVISYDENKLELSGDVLVKIVEYLDECTSGQPKGETTSPEIEREIGRIQFNTAFLQPNQPDGTIIATFNKGQLDLR